MLLHESEEHLEGNVGSQHDAPSAAPSIHKQSANADTPVWTRTRLAVPGRHCAGGSVSPETADPGNCGIA